MRTARTASPLVVPHRRPRAAQFLPAAMLFAGLVLGGPSFTEEPSTRLEGMKHYCTPRGCVNTGDNTGDGNNIYDPAGGSYVIAADG